LSASTEGDLEGRAMTAGGDPSVLFYCHEGDGLGHLSRALTIGRSLRTRSFGRPAVLIPRATIDGQVANPEQQLRAEALAQRGLARRIRPDELTPERLLGAIEELLAQPDPPRLVPGLDLGGLPATVRQLEVLLGRQ
jgi:predicted glycosyltransferase